MEYIKCSKCGGLILKSEPMRYECMVCGKQYSLDEVQRYEPKTNYSSTVASQFEQLFYALNDADAADIINKFLDGLAKNDVNDGAYEIEHHLIILYQNANEKYSSDFVGWPWGSSYSSTFLNVVSNIRDFVYSVCSQSKGRLSYEFIMNYASYNAMSKVRSAWNYELKDRWNKYFRDEDALKELIQVGDDCISILNSFDRYGPVCLPDVYDSIIFFQETLLNASYPHQYWIGDYLATEQIGLTAAAKENRRSDQSTVKAKLEKAKNIKKEIEQRIHNEEARIEAEKRAKRIDQFWIENQELKDSLLNEKEVCEKTIETLKKEKDSVNADKEISELKDEIMIANTTLFNLGFFAMKEKKAKKEEIAQLEREIENHKNRIKKEKIAIQLKIDAQLKRISEIETEFSKDRP